MWVGMDAIDHLSKKTDAITRTSLDVDVSQLRGIDLHRCSNCDIRIPLNHLHADIIEQ